MTEENKTAVARIIDLQRQRLSKSFIRFVRYFWDKVPGAQPLVEGWYIEKICDVMQDAAERVFRGEPRKHHVLINISPGSSKPVWEETMVTMADGTYKKLKNVVVGDKVIGKSGNPCKVLAVHKQGEINCTHIKTTNGRDLYAGTDHPVLTTKGWKQAKDIIPDDHVALMHNPKIESKPKARRNEEFRLAGYFIGDGSCSGGNCAITNMTPTYIEDVSHCAKSLGFDVNITKEKNGVTNIRIKRKKSDGSRLGKFKGVTRGKAPRGGPRDWLRDIGLYGLKSATKKVPDFVWHGTNDQIREFLAAYFHCDGCVSYKDGKKRSISVAMCTISKKLAKGLQRLFLRLGISMRFRHRFAKNGFKYNRGLKDYQSFHVEITDQNSAARFLEQIPLLGYKKDKLTEFVPYKSTFEQEFWPDRVVAVEDFGKLPCRCLTVETDESFIANDIVVHNSSICSILFQPWTWTRMPSSRHINASNTDALTLDFATKARHVILSDDYQTFFPEVKLRDDQATKGYYANTAGGDRFSCTVGGVSPIGRHASFLVLDDPLDPQRALSGAELDKAANYAHDVLFTRMIDKKVSVFIGVMQRLAVGDPSQVILDKAKRPGADPVFHVCLPAELTDKVNPPEWANYYIDGLMDPNRLSHQALNQFKDNAYTYASQFQQDPFMMGGGLFKIQYFSNRVLSAPYDCKRMRVWDRAASGAEMTSACFTAGVLMAKDKDGKYYVEDCVHGRWEPDERNQIMLATAHRDRTRYGPSHEPTIHIEAEGGSSGRDAWKAIARVLAGFPVYEERVTGKKDVRAEPWACMLASGNVWLVDNKEWDLQKFISEHLLFKPEPGKKLGRYKDIVDSCSAAFNLLAQQRIVGGMQVYKFSKPKQKQVQVVVLSKQELSQMTFEQEPALLLHVQDPANTPEQVLLDDTPVHGIHRLLGAKTVRFANVDPKDHQETWKAPIEPYKRSCEELVLTKETGKTLWSFLTKHRDPPVRMVVICDDDRDRGLAVAYGVTDTLRLSRKEVITVPGSADSSIVWEKGSSNNYVTDMIKRTRGMVV